MAADPVLAQIGGEPIPVELRIAPGERNPPHVDDLAHAKPRASGEIAPGVSGMPYRIEARAHAAPLGLVARLVLSTSPRRSFAASDHVHDAMTRADGHGAAEPAVAGVEPQIGCFVRPT